MASNTKSSVRAHRQFSRGDAVKHAVHGVGHVSNGCTLIRRLRKVTLGENIHARRR